MRILIVGPGAVGGFLAARLMAAGDDVALLARPARADGLRREGLSVHEGSATQTYRPRVLTAPELEPEFDLVVFAVKSDAFGSAINDVALAVGPSTAAVPFLNGMRHVEPLVARFGSAALGGVLRIATEAEDGGAIRVLAPCSRSRSARWRASRTTASRTSRRCSGLRAHRSPFPPTSSAPCGRSGSRSLRSERSRR